MKRGRRHGRLPHSRARAVAGGSNAGRFPIEEPPAQAADPRGAWQGCRFRDTMHTQHILWEVLAVATAASSVH